MDAVAEQLRVELSSAAPPRRAVVQALFKLIASSNTSTSILTDDLRVSAWRAFLGLPLLRPAVGGDAAEADLNARIRSVPLDLPNQRVVTVDAERTRPDVPSFRTPDNQRRIQTLLTYYCKEGYAMGAAAGAASHAPPPSSPISPSPSSSPPPLLPSSPPSPKPVSYRQGLNELLAPFLMLAPPPPSPPLSDADVMSVFSALVSRFAPRIFASTSDSDFVSLQCTLRLLSLLLQYHDPQLATFLEQFQCVPELFATPWILTLFARGLPRAELFALWDFLLSASRRPGPGILLALSVAFLVSHRAAIMRTDVRGTMAAELPITMSRLTFTSVAHVRRVCAHALELWAQTPLSFRRLVSNVSFSGGPGAAGGAPSASSSSSSSTSSSSSSPSPAAGSGGEPIPVSPALLSRLEKRMCVKISVEEVLLGAGSRFAATPEVQAALQRSKAALAAAQSGEGLPLPAVGDDPDASGYALLTREGVWDIPPRFFLIDVRSREEYEYGGHLPTAFHVSPELLQDPEQLEAVMAGFAGLKGVHFAILGPGDVNQWYHRPVPPTAVLSDAAAAAAAAVAAGEGSGSRGGSPPKASTVAAAAAAEESGAASSSSSATLDPAAAAAIAAAAAAAAAASEVEYAALQLGLEPLSANEEDDYGEGDASRALVALFLQRGFNRVCEVEGGFTALHQHQALFVDDVLVGHERMYCMVCTGGAAAATYAGRNALERGELIQDAAPFRPGPRQGAGGSAAAALGGAHSKSRLSVRVEGTPPEGFFSGSGGGGARASPTSLPSPAADLGGATPRPIAGGAAGAGSATPRPPGGSGVAAPVAMTTRKAVAASDRKEVVVGFDAEGLPILSEAAHLELQCDAMEIAAERRRAEGSGVGRGARGVAGAGAALAAGAAAAAAAPKAPTPVGKGPSGPAAASGRAGGGGGGGGGGGAPAPAPAPAPAAPAPKTGGGFLGFLTPPPPTATMRSLQNSNGGARTPK
jgi:hypothetical protein